MTTPEWVLEAVPRSTSRPDILAYFGVPPEPEAELESNIKRKRQFWGKRANGPGGRELAERIKKDIQNLSLVILKGNDADDLVVTEDGHYTIVTFAETVEELCEQLADLLRRGDANGVQTACRRALARWPGDAEVGLAVALSLSDLVADNIAVEEDGRRMALVTAQEAVRSRPQDARAWLAMARCSLAFDSPSAVLALEPRVASALAATPAELHGIFAAASFRTGDKDAGLMRLVNAVAASNGDPAVRSAATDTVIAEVLLPALPLRSTKDVAAFAEGADIAAWCAQDVPEAEAAVLPFRVWSVTAANQVFIGDHGLKALVGVLTGFSALPLYNRMASRPGWRVLLDGPTNARSWPGWCHVVSGSVVQELHARASGTFDWHEAGQDWPDPQAVHAQMMTRG
ncbi:hypothetical protein [Modestobacter sp. VKM Ac-2984]|uniref:hypothetical protein n=1 Tax=Modestobacter sp. VKM Ac-2984 TaxID=3004138 RepID=UPI0022AAF00F|nr:hypothetical protein [Modestobacter sp. VKM Ac-2984]MCZ2817273.1 hypothetical protein [Modestobacter sp. VKM Ac-2984]